MMELKLNKIFLTSVMSILVLSLGQSALGYGGPPAQSSAGNYSVEIYEIMASHTSDIENRNEIFRANLLTWDMRGDIQVRYEAMMNNK